MVRTTAMEHGCRSLRVSSPVAGTGDARGAAGAPDVSPAPRRRCRTGAVCATARVLGYPGVPQPTFSGTLVCHRARKAAPRPGDRTGAAGRGSLRRSRVAGTPRPSRGRPGPRTSADAPAPRAPERPRHRPRRNHDDGASWWSGQRRWSIAVVTVPAPRTGTRTRRTTSTTGPAIQALTPEEPPPWSIAVVTPGAAPRRGWREARDGSARQCSDGHG